jgi:uncharacterized sulfatase
MTITLRPPALALAVMFLTWTTGLWAAPAASDARPNILWLTCEDTGPQLGCYGDTYADTPNLDALAARGTIYSHCWSNAPVCAPARTTLISGMYPTSMGAEHMRSTVPMPADSLGILMYPQYLQQAGYYCTNNAKEDYNLAKPGQVWHESNTKAHWKNRAAGQPFFAIFNCEVTHESKVRARPHEAVHNPQKVRVPAYHPDTPEVRQDWAQYHDQITVMDGIVGKRLEELRAAGLEDETIVFFYGDHGPGMPRCKRWPYNSGLQVPLIVYVPPKYEHLLTPDCPRGGLCDRLVSFVDFAPTLLSLAGVRPPEHLQGHAFLGRFAAPEQPYVYGFRGRMDERYDLVRSVRDKRYVYLRQYMPHKIYGQHVSYMFETPTTQVWKRRFDAGQLSPEQRHFWERKPPEELYDLQADPDEVHNLASSPEHREVLLRMRKALRDWILQVRDVGFLPEHEIHARSAGSTPYELGHDAGKYPLERILDTAERASELAPEQIPELVQRLADPDSAVRYWAVLGLQMRGSEAVTAARGQLVGLFADAAPTVRVAAAETAALFGEPADQEALRVLIKSADAERNGAYLAILALNAIDGLGERAAPVLNQVPDLKVKDPNAPARANGYAERLVRTITER